MANGRPNMRGQRIGRYAAGLLALALAWAIPPHGAMAAEPVFAIGSRIGLIPAGGLVPADNYPGFEDAATETKMIVAELPGASFEQIKASFEKAKPGKRAKPEAITIAGQNGFMSEDEIKVDGKDMVRWGALGKAEDVTILITLQMPKAAAKVYTPAVMRTMLGSVTLRNEVPIAEQVTRMPFAMKDFADFKRARTLVPGAAILLTDNVTDAPNADAPYIIVSLVPGGPRESDEQARFAEQTARNIQGVSEKRLTSNETLRLGGANVYETRFEGIDERTKAKVAMVQWMRFANSAILLIVAGVAQDKWSEAFPRFRAVRDGIGPK